MTGEVNAGNIQIFHSGDATNANQARLMLCRIDYSERRVRDLATSSDGWRLSASSPGEEFTTPLSEPVVDEDFNNG